MLSAKVVIWPVSSPPAAEMQGQPGQAALMGSKSCLLPGTKMGDESCKMNQAFMESKLIKPGMHQ